MVRQAPSKIGHRPDYFLLSIIFVLTIFGLVILASASSGIGKIKFNDSYYYLKHQIIYGLSLGIAGCIVAARLHYQRLRPWTFPFLLLTLALLVLVFTGLGVSAGGAKRWISAGPISFQPSELLKITFILYLAAWLTNPKRDRTKSITEGLLPFLVVSGAIALLLLFQPATSTVVVLIGSGLVVYFFSGARAIHIVAVGVLGLMALFLIVLASPYRLERILTFIHPGSDIEGAGYQINQALIAIGSGRVFGQGYGESTSKMVHLPTPIDDSIFAVAAQELGFAGAGTIVVLFGMLTFRLLWLAKNLRDRFGQLILIGFAAIIAAQSVVHIGGNLGVLPLTGVPLPFVSYGGTALAIFLTMGGIAANISKYT